MASTDDGAARTRPTPSSELDALIDRLVDTAEGVRRAQGRMRGLFAAIETVTGDLSLDLVLRNIIESARDLVGARYGALGVIGPRGDLEQFIHVGMPEDVAATIGPLPRGYGLLGALIRDPRPIRLQHIPDDQRSIGFPANHPPMDSFLGVAIHARGEVFGNLYLADSERGSFSSEDEELVAALALAAGTAISNARLYQEAQLKQRWLEASVEISARLLAQDGEDPLRTIARSAIEIADADVVSIGLATDDNTGLMVEVALGSRADEIVGRRLDLAGTLALQVIESGEPALVARTNDLNTPLAIAQALPGVGPVMVLPLRAGGHSRGALTLARRDGRAAFTTTDLSMTAGFASHASVALELADARSADQRLKMHEERDRIARDLHDHVIQELFAIGLGLDGVAFALEGDPPLQQRVKQRVADLDRTIRRIRTSIFDLRGKLGTSVDGLSRKVLDVASDVTPALGFAPHVAFAGLVEIGLSDDVTEDVIACVRETLTNVAKHARATSASIDVELVADLLTISVTDDGIGVGPDATRASGTANLRKRAEQRGGSFELAAAASGGTVATWKTYVR